MWYLLGRRDSSTFSFLPLHTLDSMAHYSSYFQADSFLILSLFCSSTTNARQNPGSGWKPAICFSAGIPRPLSLQEKSCNCVRWFHHKLMVSNLSWSFSAAWQSFSIFLRSSLPCFEEFSLPSRFLKPLTPAYTLLSYPAEKTEVFRRELLHFPDRWCADKCLMTVSLGLGCGEFWFIGERCVFPWWKYSHCGQIQAVNMW